MRRNQLSISIIYFLILCIINFCACQPPREMEKNDKKVPPKPRIPTAKKEHSRHRVLLDDEGMLEKKYELFTKKQSTSDFINMNLQRNKQHFYEIMKSEQPSIMRNQKQNNESSYANKIKDKLTLSSSNLENKKQSPPHIDSVENSSKTISPKSILIRKPHSPLGDHEKNQGHFIQLKNNSSSEEYPYTENVYVESYNVSRTNAASSQIKKLQFDEKTNYKNIEAPVNLQSDYNFPKLVPTKMKEKYQESKSQNQDIIKSKNNENNHLRPNKNQRNSSSLFQIDFSSIVNKAKSQESQQPRDNHEKINSFKSDCNNYYIEQSCKIYDSLDVRMFKTINAENFNMNSNQQSNLKSGSPKSVNPNSPKGVIGLIEERLLAKQKEIQNQKEGLEKLRKHREDENLKKIIINQLQTSSGSPKKAQSNQETSASNPAANEDTFVVVGFETLKDNNRYTLQRVTVLYRGVMIYDCYVSFGHRYEFTLGYQLANKCMEDQAVVRDKLQNFIRGKILVGYKIDTLMSSLKLNQSRWYVRDIDCLSKFSDRVVERGRGRRFNFMLAHYLNTPMNYNHVSADTMALTSQQIYLFFRREWEKDVEQLMRTDIDRVVPVRHIGPHCDKFVYTLHAIRVEEDEIYGINLEFTEKGELYQVTIDDGWRTSYNVKIAKKNDIKKNSEVDSVKVVPFSEAQQYVISQTRGKILVGYHVATSLSIYFPGIDVALYDLALYPHDNLNSPTLRHLGAYYLRKDFGSKIDPLLKTNICWQVYRLLRYDLEGVAPSNYKY